MNDTSRRRTLGLALRALGFTVWSSIVHGGVMAVQSVMNPQQHLGHLAGDVPALFIVAVVLAWLCPRAFTLKLSIVAPALLVAACFAAPDAARAADDSEPSVVPYRPSVSTPAYLSAPGRLELELGVIRTRGGGLDHVDALPYTLKLAFTPDWGIRIGGNAWMRAVDTDGSSVSGGGDTAVVLKRRFEVDAERQSAFGVELGVSRPTARSGLGSGSTDWTVNGIYSTDFASRLHTDMNLNVTRFGADTPGVSRQQLGWAASVSGPNNAAWGLGFELSGTHRSGSPSTAQWLLAVSHPVGNTLALDAGVSHGLNASSPGWSIFGGMTLLLPKLF